MAEHWSGVPVPLCVDCETIWAPRLLSPFYVPTQLSASLKHQMIVEWEE